MSKFNNVYDVNALAESLNEIKQNSGNGDYPEVPVGKYEVKVEKVELGSTKDGVPMGKIQFRINDGDYKKQCLFYNQVLVGKDKNTGQLSAFGIHKFNEFLRSLDPINEQGLELPIEFKDFDQYEQLLLDVAECVESLVYEIQYGKNNDFPTFKILNIFED